MSRKAKNTNEMFFEDKTKIVDLPNGYFYKNRFYSGESCCFKALLEDGEVRVSAFPNGTWEIGNTLYPSLETLYEWEEDRIASPYKEFKTHYADFGVTHSASSCTKYAYTRDDYNQLFDTKGEVLQELRNETDILEDDEDRECRYLDGKTKEECIAYFKKPIKERIRLLEEMK